MTRLLGLSARERQRRRAIRVLRWARQEVARNAAQLPVKIGEPASTIEPVAVTWAPPRMRLAGQQCDILRSWGVPLTLTPDAQLAPFVHTSAAWGLFDTPGLAVTGAYIQRVAAKPELSAPYLQCIAWVSLQSRLTLSEALWVTRECMAADWRQAKHPRAWANDWATFWVGVVNVLQARHTQGGRHIGDPDRVAGWLRESLDEFAVAQIAQLEMDVDVRRTRFQQSRRGAQ